MSLSTLVEGKDGGLKSVDTIANSHPPRGGHSGQSDVTLESTWIAVAPEWPQFQPMVRGGGRGRPIIPLYFVIHFLT